MINKILMVFMLASTCCLTPPAPVVPESTCAQAQKKLNDLNCEMRVTKKGALFVEYCNHYSLQRIDIGAACVADSKSCKEAEKCK